jgi:arylsulfatase A-like enzyme/Zn-dependent M28 family amino/carboxypeptidase
MNKLASLVLIAAMSMQTHLHGAEKSAKAPARKMNVLYIISDDLTATALSCYGNKVCKTPNIDRLAARGMLFTRAYCQGAYCGPSRASIMSGYYPHATGVQGYTSPRPAIGDRATWAEFFKLLGYYTARIGKIFHMGVPGEVEAGANGADDPASWTERFNSQGPEWKAPGIGETLEGNSDGKRPIVGGNTFVVVAADGDDLVHADGKTAAKACELIAQHKDRPFFLAVGFVRPHVPFVSPASYHKAFPWNAMTLPDKFPGDWDDIPKAGINYKTSVNMKMDEVKQKKAIAGYYAAVTYMDAQVGKVLDALKQAGLEDHTIIIFTSDHGFHLGEHDFWAKVSLHEESAAVPLIISVPGKKPGVSRSLVELLDLYPTTVKLCGFDVPARLQGKDLTPILDDPKHEVRDTAFCVSGGSKAMLLRDDRWAYIQYGEDAKGGVELYDMNQDPKQYTNLAPKAEYAPVVAAFKKKLAAKLAQVRTNDLGANRDASSADLSAERIKASVAQLASDRFEGRAPGTRGELLTIEYLADEFKKAGLKPLGKQGSYFQPVPLVRVQTSPKSTLQAIMGDKTLDIPCEEGFSGTGHTQREREEFEAEAVFVGHGITAPEFDWDDYKGIDVAGKVVVAFTNEPPSDDPKYFGGKALTYYGRWTYRFEEAARRGARACFIIHTPETAGYPYSVVRPLEGAQLPRVVGQPALAFAGWLSRASGEKLLALAGRTVEGALKESNTKGFKAYSLGFKLKGNVQTRVDPFTSNNVVGIAEGSDPALKAEAVLFTAHWDHLGVGRSVLGDAVYNGAADNATGCALLVELARAWALQSPRPKRSAIFLAVTAEEKGLLGSKHYARHPLVPLGKTALNINFDMILPLGVPESVVVTGAERTTAWPLVKAAAARNGLEIEVDQRAHLGIFYRSDHFSLAKAGVPAFSVGAGMKIKGKPADFAAKAYKDFNDNAYHAPQDEMKSDWDFSGFVTLGRFALDAARAAADAERLPTWNEGDEFRAARDMQ